ncbi:hypothetical protein ACFXTH_029730 [Malus domestica]
MAKQNRISRTDKSGIVSMEVERTFENGSAFRHGALMSEIDLANMSDDEIFHMVVGEKKALCFHFVQGP